MRLRRTIEILPLHKSLLVLIILTLGVQACNYPSTKASPASSSQVFSSTTPPGTPLPTLTEPELITLTATELITPTVAVTLTAPSSAQSGFSPSCLVPKAHPALAPSDFNGYPETILNFLNAGATFEELQQALTGAGVANQPIPILAGDMTGERKDDIVVSIFDPTSQSNPKAGVLLIYVCQDDRYVLAFNQPDSGGPHLWMLQDLDADGRADLVDSTGSCGASTCFEEVRVYSWDGSEFVNRLEGSSKDLPYPVIQVADPQGHQVYQIQVAGTDFGSIGAGPTRHRTWVWTYQPESWHWIKTDEVLDPPVYRVHALYDAEDAARNGGYDQAIVLYQKVIGDPSLKSWGDPVQEQANLGAYARFKMFMIYQIQGQSDLAQIVMKDLNDTFPSGTPQAAFVEMASAFEKSYAKGDLKAGCAEVEKYATTHKEQILDLLNSFGYANPTYTAQDLCLGT